MTEDPQTAEPGARIALIRLAIGVAQGLAAWQLLQWVPKYSGDGKPPLTFAQTHPLLFASLVLITAYVPLIVLAEIRRMPRRVLAIWGVVATIALVLLAAYDLWRDPLGGELPRYWPSADLIISSALALFIANQLVAHRTGHMRLFGAYAAYFEDSWMRVFQLFLSLTFTGVFWGVLELGRALFDLIHLTGFGQLIEKDWFRSPVLAGAFALAVHLTDVRPALLRGIRNLGLLLLSWQLPVAVALCGAFLIALPFTGLQPLWATRFAASILLWAASLMLILINAAYNDGTDAHRPMLPLRLAVRGAGPVMLVMAALAAYAIGLRVGQHGWTPQRVRAAAVALIALVYGLGYGVAALRRGPWMRDLERVNVASSFVMLGVLVALISPLADPARLSVNSQVARLHSGAVKPDQFDYWFLKTNAGRFGAAALDALAHDPNRAIADRARVAQRDKATYHPAGAIDPHETEKALSHVTVLPAGARLPADFTPDKLESNVPYTAQCLRDGTPCDVIVWAQPGSPLLVVRDPENAVAMTQPVLGRNPSGKWALVGRISNAGCPAVLDGLRKGEAQSVRPLHDDLMVGGIRLEFLASTGSDESCTQPQKPIPKAVPVRAPAPAGLGPAFSGPGG